MIDSVVFDLDGTLLNTLEDLCDAVNYCMDCYGFPRRTLDEVRRFVGNGLYVLTKRAAPQEIKPALLEQAFETLRDYYTKNSNHKTRLYPGIDLLVRELKEKGYGLAIVSNKNDQAVKDLAKIYFSGEIEVAIGTTDGVKKKPAPDSVFRALSLLHSVPKRALYVGDSEVDVATAQNAGCDLVCVSWGFRSREEQKNAGAKHMADNWRDIMDYLDKVNNGLSPAEMRKDE